MSGATALVLGTVLAVGALAFVLHPLFFDTRRSARRPGRDQQPSAESAVVALREIEFDRATGKLSESDYAELKTQYSTRALAEMRAAAGTAASPEADPVEARVRAYRESRKECGNCGLRPEPDAVYCSTCGSYLDRRCPGCGTAIAEPSAAFCSTCGLTLAEGRERAFV
jgi:hypothetical protein